MAVQNYRRKPDDRHKVLYTAAKFEHGKPLTDLMRIARMAGEKAEVAEAVFPSGRSVLVVLYEQYCDGERIGTDTEVVEDGEYLLHSSASGYLHTADAQDLEQFYNPAEEY